MSVDEARRTARKAVEDREVMCKHATAAELAAQRTKKHLLEVEIALTVTQAIKRHDDGRYQRKFAAWSRGEGEKPELPQDRAGELAEAERTLELARNAVEAAEREAKEALNAYGRAINQVEDCAVAVLVEMADEVAAEMNEARLRVLSSYDQLAALMSVQPKSSRNGIVLSAKTNEVLLAVRALADERFPPHVAGAQAPHQNEWRALYTELLGKEAT